MENKLLTTNLVESIFHNKTLDIMIEKDADFSTWKILDFNNDIAKVNVYCKQNSFSKIIVVNHQNVEVHFNIENNAELRINFLSIEKNAQGKYEFNIQNNAKVLAAMADLSKGNIDFSATFNLKGDDSSAQWHLATLGAENDQKIFNINFNHFAKRTYGMMSNYGVVENNSQMHFKGISHIRHSALESKTHQSAKIMVFDANCRAKANPILKIDENNIEASHAAVVGRVNDEHMFYLQSRGIKEVDAKQLITLGYLKPITKFFESDEYKNEIINGIEKRL